MTEINEVATAKTVWESCKKIFSLIKERKFWSAFKEFFVCLEILYAKYLKGRYVTVKGKRIPLTLIVIVALLGLYVVYPSSDESQTREQAMAEEVAAREKLNTYNKDGLRIYDLQKCDQAVCGLMENASDKNFKQVSVAITFHTQKGTVIYEGGVEAMDVQPRTRMKITIPCEGDFAYFKLKDVIVEEF